MFKKTSSKSAVTMSVISLALCFVMLLGTTFAWWSTSTSSLVNTVKSGNLYIDLVDSNDADASSLVGKTLSFVDADENTLWEPGCSYTVEDVFLKNTGTCDIKYKVEVIGIDGDSDLADVITWTVNGQAATAFEGKLASGETSDAIQLAGSMDPNAGNQYMNKTADGIAIAVYATQDNDDATYEQVVALIQELDVDTIEDVELDTAYTFKPIPGAPEEKYANWNADYVIYFNQDVEAGKVTLAGSYEAWNNGAWESFTNPEIAAGTEIRLLKDSNDIYVTYDECCNLVKEFSCGAASDVSGLTMTVELRLFERVNGVETGEYVTAGVYNYTF